MTDLDTDPGRDGTGPTTDELDRLALAAAGDDDVPDDAVAWTDGAAADAGLLPGWYMPPAVARRRGRGTRVVVGLVILGFLVINAAGLCVTYGLPS